LKPRGNKGEVLAELLSDFPERFSNLKQIWVGQGDGEPQAISLQNFWVDRNHTERGVFHFASCATIPDAEKFRGRQCITMHGLEQLGANHPQS